eukprot:160351-Amphidinium_carterae.1
MVPRFGRFDLEGQKAEVFVGRSSTWLPLLEVEGEPNAVVILEKGTQMSTSIATMVLGLDLSRKRRATAEMEDLLTASSSLTVLGTGLVTIGLGG